MIKTYISLYKSCKILPENNFVVDSIEDYLATLQKTDFTYNYVRLGLFVTLRLNENSGALNFANESANYIKMYHLSDALGSSPEKVCYYFVVDKEWTSDNCVTVSLRMDTLNTFAYNTDYTLSSRTHVVREHKNRYTADSATITVPGVESAYDGGEWKATVNISADFPISSVSAGSPTSMTIDSFTVSGHSAAVNLVFDAYYVGSVGLVVTSGLMRVIDMTSEGISPILYRKTSKEVAEEFAPWYLIYKTLTTDPGSAVECLLTMDRPADVEYYGDEYIQSTDMPTSDWCAVACQNNDDMEFSLTFPDGGVAWAKYTSPGIPAGWSGFVMRKNGTDIDLEYWIKDALFTYKWWGGTYSQVTININSDKVFTAEGATAEEAMTRAFNGTRDNYISLAGYLTGTLQTISTLDRTDPKIVKIIKLPYCPIDFRENLNGTLTFSQKVTFVSPGFLKVQDVTASFTRHLKNVENPLFIVTDEHVPVIGENRILNSDPKLYHSDFWQPKVVYDSFSLPLFAERVDMQKVIPANTIEFCPTSTIHAKFIFRLPDYISSLIYPDSDFPGVLAVARNNELTLYNSDYLNYLRTGYNYDIKAKEKREIVTGVSAGVSIAGAVAGVVGGVATHNPALVVTGVMAGVSVAGTLINSAVQIAQAEDNIQSKLLQLREQSAAVSGSDDVDLLDAYGGNVLYINVYECSPKVKRAMDDLFYYCGYVTDEYKIPAVNTRTFFNFVQAELSIVGTKNIPQNVIQDVKERFAVGVTFLHKVLGSWDFEQIKENWETSILS